MSTNQRQGRTSFVITIAPHADRAKPFPLVSDSSHLPDDVRAQLENLLDNHTVVYASVYQPRVNPITNSVVGSDPDKYCGDVVITRGADGFLARPEVDVGDLSPGMVVTNIRGLWANNGFGVYQFKFHWDDNVWFQLR